MADTLSPVTDAMTVGDDPVLDSLGAFLAASLLSEPKRTTLVEPAPVPAPIVPRPVVALPVIALPVAPRPVVPQPVVNRTPPARPAPPSPVAPPVERSVPEVEATPDEAPESPERADDGTGPSRLRVTLEWIAIIAAALTVALVIRVVVIQSYVIPSESMHPTLQADDRVLVNRLAYKAHDIRRGDVVVFDRPKSAALGKDTPEHLIKRVIGLPGDTIVARDGVVYIDGRRLREPYLPPGTLTNNLDTSITIPAGHVWVMGDNRMNSTDSRIFGPISVKLVVGRAFARVWPLSRIGFL